MLRSYKDWLIICYIVYSKSYITTADILSISRSRFISVKHLSTLFLYTFPISCSDRTGSGNIPCLFYFDYCSEKGGKEQKVISREIAHCIWC